MTHAHILQLREALNAKNLDSDIEFFIDGKIHKYHCNAHQGKDTKSEWYVLHYTSSGHVVGAFGSHRLYPEESFRFFSGAKNDTYTEEQINEFKAKNDQIKKEYEEEKRVTHEKAAAKAKHLWESAEIAPDDFPYLVSKKLKGTGLKYLKGDNPCIIVPMHDEIGNIRNLQLIYADGKKRNLTGGQVSGCFYTNGDLKHARYGNVVEGWADGETITLANSCPSVVTFGVNNIIVVAAFLKNLHPSCKFNLYADNDHKTGAIKNEWEAFIKTEIFIPSDKDFSDVYVKHGIDKVKAEIKTKKIATLTSDTILDMDIQPLAFKVDNLIIENSVHIIYGSTGIGKSFFTLDMCICMAEGIPFMQRKVPKPQRVLYVDHEMGLQIIQPRLKILYPAHDITSPNKNLSIAPYDMIDNLKLDFSKETSQELINRELDSYDVIVFDNYMTLTQRVEHENLHLIWDKFFKWAQMLTKIKGKTFILVHHTNKDRETMAGASTMANDPDIIIRLTKPLEPANHLSIIASIEKPRTIDPKYQKPFKCDLMMNGWDVRPYEHQPIKSKKQ